MNGLFPFAGDLSPDLASLRQRLDEIFQGGASTSIRAMARGAFPAVNVGTSPDNIEVLAFAPGVDSKSLQITVNKGVLIIAGERNGAAHGDGENIYAQERFTGSFRRVISLPDDADPARVDAKLRDGLLRITVAKRESSKPRQIAVN